MGAGPTTQAIFAERCRGTLSAEMAVMRLLLLHRDVAEALRELRRAAEDSTCVAAELLGLLQDRADAAATIVALADRADGIEGAGGREASLDRCRRLFDWAVRTNPETSVALYSLGAASSLAAATGEVVDLMQRRGVLGADRDVLDVGCGIGRLSLALAGRVRSIVGVDISEGMVAEARRRCGSLVGMAFEVTSGSDLQPFADATFDTVIAVDFLPYVFQSGGREFAGAHFAEMARVLKPVGDILALNLSYRGDMALDRADAARFARSEQLELCCAGAAELRSWDGRTFHWHRLG